MTEVDDASIERMRAAAAAAAERDVSQAKPPGLADVIARARAIDPDAADEHAIVTASRIDDARERRGGSAGPDALAIFVAAARRLAEADVRDRESEGVPPRRRSARPAWVVPVALAIAAAALVVITAGITQMRSTRLGDATPHTQAPSVVEHGTRTESVEPSPIAPSRAPAVAPPIAPPPVDAAPVQTPSEPKPKRPSTDAQLRALAEQAEAALARGDHGEADELFARLIAIGGRHPLVELAYGDRFTIAHQRGIIGQQTKLWRAYLGKFPRGRFADDARAGLCRHAAAKDEASCWTDYLADFPKGAYRGLAARSLAESPEP